jgi:ubiquinone/menaquinone biosynthesis C-methylase UbiE
MERPAGSGVAAREARSRVRAEEARVRAAYERRVTGDRYAFSNPAYLYQLQERERATLALLARHGLLPLGARSVLEVGCGAGQWLRDLVRWGAEPSALRGVDLLAGRLAEARASCAPGIGLAQASVTELPFPSGRLDLVLQATVFTSILDPDVRRAAAREMLRVLRPGGAILWYDYYYDNPRNPDVRRVGRQELEALFPGCRAAIERVTLAPPVTRLLARRARLLCDALARVPWLRTHYLGLIWKP